MLLKPSLLGPDSTPNARKGAAIMGRRRALALMASGSAAAMWRIFGTEEKVPPPTGACLTLDELPHGSSLIGQEVAIETPGAGIQCWVRTQIVRRGAELAVIIQGAGTYVLKDTFFEKPAGDIVTSITYDRKKQEVHVASESRLPPLNTSGNAFVARTQYEELLRMLALSAPESASPSIEGRYKAEPFLKGKGSVALHLERESSGQRIV